MFHFAGQLFFWGPDNGLAGLARLGTMPLSQKVSSDPHDRLIRVPT